jgi:hypothetical protein
MLSGVLIPLSEKPAPLSAIEEIVKFSLPKLLSTRFAVPFDPTATVPKLIGLCPSESCGSGLTAVAERFATTGALPEFPLTVSVPATVPAALGLTTTVKLLVCPTASPSGVDSPVTLNCAFDKLACVIFSGMVPEFVTDTACVDCLPTLTLPKLIVVELSWKDAALVGAPDAFVVVTTPAHPFSNPITAASSKSGSKTRFPGFSQHTQFMRNSPLIRHPMARTLDTSTLE